MWTCPAEIEHQPCPESGYEIQPSGLNININIALAPWPRIINLFTSVQGLMILLNARPCALSGNEILFELA
jgi:hypothetical protein